MTCVALALEWIGMDGDQVSASPMGRALGAKPLRRPWVAQILGADPRYGLKRHFLRSETIDYSQANSVGSRGVRCRYFLGPGLYEVRSFLTWSSEDRYFAILRPGAKKLERLDAAQVESWIGILDYFLEDPEESGDDAQDLLG